VNSSTRFAVALVVLLPFSSMLQAEQPPSHLPRLGSCGVVRGRAAHYNGGHDLWIWAVGTHHMYWIDNDPPNIGVLLPDWDHVPFADFTLCPTTTYKSGSAQGARVEKIERTALVDRK
jgi:hypothetical protein